MSTPLNPSFSMPVAPILALPNLTLADDEARVLQVLTTRLFEQREYLLLRGLYYDGLQRIEDLGISIPPTLSRLRTVIGWPQIGIDAIDERCSVEGFRYPGSTEVDDDLASIWQANNLDLESSLAQLDTLIYGRAYTIVGPGDDTTAGEPLITAESPLNMIASWDARLRRPTAGLQMYLDTNLASDMYGAEIAAIYLPNKSIFLTRNTPNDGVSTGTGLSAWKVFERDDHQLGRLPIVRIANRQRLSSRDGLSEITPAWMNTTDSGCRTLLGMEVGREFHAAPRRYVLGAAEDAFKSADGKPVNAWDAYMGKFWGLERDEDGNVPVVGEFKTGDPSTYTKLIDTYTKIMAGLTCLPPHYMGLISDGNPASADAIRSEEARLIKRVQRKMEAFGEAWEETMRLALLVRDGSIPDQAHRLETDWIDPNTPTPLQTTQSVTMQINAGMMPATSDVALKEVGYSAVQRARIIKERAANPAQEELAELVNTEARKLLVGATRLENNVVAPADNGTTGPSQTAP